MFRKKKDNVQPISGDYRLLGTLLDGSDNFIGLINRDYVYEIANNRYYSIFTDKYQPLTGKKVETLWKNMEYEIFIRPAVDKCFRGEPARIERELHIGSERVVTILLKYMPVKDECGAVTHVIEVGSDISKLTQTEQKLRESDLKYRTVIDTQTEIIARFLPDGTLTFINNAFCDFFGGEESGIIGLNINTFFPDGEKIDFNVFSINYYPPNLPVRYDQNRMVTGKGEIKIVEWIIKALFSEDGVITEFQSSGRDITNKLALQTKLDETRKENELHEKMLMRAERLSSLGTLSSAIAHEIRQPLNAIKILADSVIFWEKENCQISHDDLLENFYKISQNVERIDNIIQNMSKMIKPKDKIDITPININKSIENVISIMGQKLKNHSIKLELNLDEKIRPIKIAEVEFQQVLVNIITNALNILDTILNPYKKISITTIDSENMISIRIADNGPGVADDIREKIFDPFFTTNVKSDGMGLGLYIVNMIIKSFNGSVDIIDGDEPGACFEIKLYRRQK